MHLISTHFQLGLSVTQLLRKFMLLIDYSLLPRLKSLIGLKQICVVEA
jgi:hypothetical protein